MNQQLFFACLFGLSIICGCSNSDSAISGKHSNVMADTGDEDGHSHSKADKLVWPATDLEHEGYVLTLGHHGNHFHAGDTIEPAAMISRNGKEVVDARVFNSLVSEDGQEILVDEVETVLEPATDNEPAHFAQGALQIPDGTTVFQIRFRIEFPDVEQPFISDVRVAGH